MTSPYALLAVPFGVVAGSYATTLGQRWARGEQATFGRSHCDGCHRVLGFWETAPLVSYAASGGRCGACDSRIDPVHPLGEAVGGLVAFLAFALAAPGRAPLVLAIGLALWAAAVVDARIQKLPDPLSLVVAAAGLALAALNGAPAVLAALASAAVTLAVLSALRGLLSALRGRTALGWGDVKLAAALALWLGWSTPWALAAASLAGLVHALWARPAGGRIPFGPALGIGAAGVGLAVEAGWFPAAPW